jgi:hypothetical protein
MAWRSEIDGQDGGRGGHVTWCDTEKLFGGGGKPDFDRFTGQGRGGQKSRQVDEMQRLAVRTSAR